MLAAISPAVADVTVDDPFGCLREEDLDLEVRQILGDAAVDRVQLLAQLYGASSWQLSLQVTDGDELLWGRVMSVERADCQFLPALVARSVERGLSSLPGWGIGGQPRQADLPMIAIVASGTVPLAARLSLGTAVWLPISGPLGLELDLEGYGSFIEPIEQGGAQIIGIWAGPGPAVRFDVGRDSLWASARAVIGPAVVIGRGIRLPEEPVTPHAAVLGDLGFAWRHGLRFSVRSEIPLIRLAPNLRCSQLTTGTQTGVCERPGVPEPPLRIGLAIGYGGSLGSSEGPSR